MHLFGRCVPSGSDLAVRCSGCLRRPSRPRPRRTTCPRSLEELPPSLLRLQLFILLFHRGLLVMAPLLQLPEQPVELEFLFQGTQCLFDVPGLDPYLHDLPPPPPPPRSPLPPPPDPERSVLGLASFTVIVRSMNDVPFMAVIALAASSSDAISTNPNPLDLPFV